jgi:sporulation protein YlmC with PRC-barrel domain
MNEDRLERDETSTLISADKVEGTSVMNTAGEKLGSIEDIMIDKRSGRVAYAVMSFGGFLGSETSIIRCPGAS